MAKKDQPRAVDQKTLHYWCDKLRIEAITKSVRHNAFRDYICNALLGKLAPYYLVRNTLRDLRPVPSESRVFKRLTDLDHKDKFTGEPIDWSQYDRLDISCFAVHTILTTIRTEAALAGEDGHSLDAIPKLPPGLDYKEEVSLAYRLLSMMNAFMKGRAILSPHAVPSTRYDQAMREWLAFDEKEGFGRHLDRIVGEARQKHGVAGERKSSASIDAEPGVGDGQADFEDEENAIRWEADDLEAGEELEEPEEHEEQEEPSQAPPSSRAISAVRASIASIRTPSEVMSSSDDPLIKFDVGTEQVSEEVVVKQENIITERKGGADDSIASRKRRAATSGYEDEETLVEHDAVPDIAERSMRAEVAQTGSGGSEMRAPKLRKVNVKQSPAAALPREANSPSRPTPSLPSNTPGSERSSSVPKYPPLKTTLSAASVVDLTMDDDADVKQEVGGVSGRTEVSKPPAGVAIVSDGKEERAKKRELERVKLQLKQLDLEEELEMIEEKKQNGKKVEL
ncbi:hypothetical protein LTR56_022756 [Elasticomyces elasticus]|nr:hypothetical protein LTR56_022756 [Elasticomyces elasticus]KAK3627818.1 hypothetical protein LTR22_022590 [Elasticomyces elasticus]KAK4907914.1 hypothetical protein LTR49_023117 [Elasticomyces elasticus]KAK5748042.1 hypothetical protein LTS12_021902 [Elasticomyces elasticus]